MLKPTKQNLNNIKIKITKIKKINKNTELNNIFLYDDKNLISCDFKNYLKNEIKNEFKILIEQFKKRNRRKDKCGFFEIFKRNKYYK